MEGLVNISTTVGARLTHSLFRLIRTDIKYSPGLGKGFFRMQSKVLIRVHSAPTFAPSFRLLIPEMGGTLLAPDFLSGMLNPISVL